MLCCNEKSNLVPLIFSHKDSRLREWVYNVSHFTCIRCLSRIPVDDRFKRLKKDFNSDSDYALEVLKGYNIEGYK